LRQNGSRYAGMRLVFSVQFSMSVLVSCRCGEGTKKPTTATDLTDSTDAKPRCFCIRVIRGDPWSVALPVQRSWIEGKLAAAGGVTINQGLV
jgi:hypothetical protein